MLFHYGVSHLNNNSLKALTAADEGKKATTHHIDLKGKTSVSTVSQSDTTLLQSTLQCHVGTFKNRWKKPHVIAEKEGG